MNRQRAIVYLENLFLGLLKDMERSTRILNDREIERGTGNKKLKTITSIPTVRKRRLNDTDEEGDGSTDEGHDQDQKCGERVIGNERVGISLRLKSRTTG